MHRIKRIIILCFLLTSSNIYSLSVGITGKTQATKMVENKFIPDFIINSENNIYLNIDFNFNNLFADISPSLNISDELKFKFYFFNLLYASDYFALGFAKKNIYFGNGLDVNPLFFNLPIKTAFEDNIWNGKISYINNNVCFTLGTVFDSEKVDDFDKPDWYNCFFTSLLSNENFAWYCNADFLESQKKELKLASEFDFSYIQNLSLYTSANYLLNFNSSNSNLYSMLVGSSYFIDDEKLEHLYIIEAGIYNNKIFTSACTQWKLFDLFSIEEKFSYIDDKVYLSSQLSFEVDMGKLRLEYKSPDLKNFDEREDFLSISYELKGKI